MLVKKEIKKFSGHPMVVYKDWPRDRVVAFELPDGEVTKNQLIGVFSTRELKGSINDEIVIMIEDHKKQHKNEKMYIHLVKIKNSDYRSLFILPDEVFPTKDFYRIMEKRLKEKKSIN